MHGNSSSIMHANNVAASQAKWSDSGATGKLFAVSFKNTALVKTRKQCRNGATEIELARVCSYASSRGSKTTILFFFPCCKRLVFFLFFWKRLVYFCISLGVRMILYRIQKTVGLIARAGRYRNFICYRYICLTRCYNIAVNFINYHHEVLSGNCN